MNQSRRKFLLARKNGIGGSDIAAIAGVSPYKSPLDVYYDKITELSEAESEEAIPIGSTARFYWGSVHEANIGRAYTLVTGRRLMRYNRQIRHPEKPYFIGDIDFLAYGDDGKRPFITQTGLIRTNKGIECKTSRFASADEWGDHGSDQVPIGYVCQVQWYMGLIPSLESFDLPVLFGGSDFRIYTIVRDENIITRLQEIGERFWQNHIAKRIPPPPRTLEEVKRLYPESSTSSIVASTEIESIVRALAALKDQQNTLTEAEKKYKDRIAVELAANDTLTLPDGRPILTYRTDKSGKRTMLLKRINL